MCACMHAHNDIIRAARQWSIIRFGSSNSEFPPPLFTTADLEMRKRDSDITDKRLQRATDG